MAVGFDPARVLDRPGYFGKRRREKEVEYNAAHGLGGWQEMWQVGDWFFSFEEAVALYDGAYHVHVAWEGLATWLCSFLECYDDRPDNVLSGVIPIRSPSRAHLQDVSVRRALVRMVRWFQGTELLQIRGSETNGHRLMPGNVPRHRPNLILAHGGPTRTG